MCDGVLSQVGRRQQRLDGAHLSLRAAEETAGVAGAHPHHPPGDKEGRKEDTDPYDKCDGGEVVNYRGYKVIISKGEKTTFGNRRNVTHWNVNKLTKQFFFANPKL